MDEPLDAATHIQVSAPALAVSPRVIQPRTLPLSGWKEGLSSVVVEPFSEIGKDIARSVVAQQTRLCTTRAWSQPVRIWKCRGKRTFAKGGDACAPRMKLPIV